MLGLAKKELERSKIRHNIPISLNGEDIIPLLNKAWKQSFGKNRTNRKAIATWGWFPLNQKLLLQKEILETESNSQNAKNATNEINERNDTLPFVLNSTKCTSGACFQKMMQPCLRNGGIERNQEYLQYGESIEAIFQKGQAFFQLGYDLSFGSYS
jgi:hypothetical protein